MSSREVTPERESFVFYKSFFDQLEELAVEDAFPLYRAIARYGLLHEEPDLKGVQKVVFIGVRAQLEANWKRWKNGCQGAKFGKLGGNPNFKKGQRNPYYQGSKDNPNITPEITPNENDNVNVNEKGGVGGRRFTPPTLSEVEAYIREKGYGVDAGAFVDFYESKGWMIGKNRMKEWRAAVRTWNSKDKLNTTQNHETPILNI